MGNAPTGTRPRGAFHCALVGFARKKRRRLRPVMVGLVVGLACFFSVMATHWPLRIAYLLSRPAIERLGSQTLAGQPPGLPSRAGEFVIVKAEVNRAGVVCLLDPGESGWELGIRPVRAGARAA